MTTAAGVRVGAPYNPAMSSKRPVIGVTVDNLDDAPRYMSTYTYAEAAFADPDTRDEELDMGQVRITGNQSSIVYDRSIDIIHEYLRPDGIAILNADSAYGARLAAELACPRLTFSRGEADASAPAVAATAAASVGVVMPL